jgi:hypothetical protein
MVAPLGKLYAYAAGGRDEIVSSKGRVILRLFAAGCLAQADTVTANLS